MGSAMIVFGEVSLPPSVMALYLAHVVDPARREDWIDGLSAVTAPAPRTVRELVRELPAEVSEPGLHFTVDERAGRLEVHGALVEDELSDLGAVVAELFRVAGELGGRGELFFLEEQVMLVGPEEPELCYRVEVSPKGSKVSHPSQPTQERAMKTDGFRAAAELVGAAAGDPA
jgi:hypothetical protein